MTGPLPSVTPHRFADPASVARAIAEVGAGVLTGIATEADALDAGREVMGSKAVRAGRQFQASKAASEAEYAQVQQQAADEYGRKRQFAQVKERMTAHNDGFAFGDYAPDYLFLWCKQPASSGGDSFLIDGAALVDSLPDDLRAFCWDVPVDHSEPTIPQNNPQPLARRTATGRVQVRFHPFQSSVDGNPDTEAMLQRWRAAVIAARDTGEMFRAEARELICLDNYRLLHGRDAYTDPARELYSLWGWSTDAVAIPTGDLDIIAPDLAALAGESRDAP